MTQPTNTFDSYDSIGNKEDVLDEIFNIAPTETPFLTMAKKSKAFNTLHEWQTDTLANVADNKVIEGDEATLDAVTPTVRLGNYTQISDKTCVISGTTEAVKRYGRGEEMAYQMVKKTKELKRDMENALVGLNNAKAVGNNSTPRELASVQSWIATNTSYNTGDGGNPTGDGTDARTDGTQRAFTESLLQDAMSLLWTNSGVSDMCTIFTGAFNKRVLSGFTGNATRLVKAESKKLEASIDFYVSDFGELKVVMDRHLRTRDVLILNMDYWAVAYLRPFQTRDLAVTGDSNKKQLLVEYTLEARDERASAGVFDLTTS